MRSAMRRAIRGNDSERLSRISSSLLIAGAAGGTLSLGSDERGSEWAGRFVAVALWDIFESSVLSTFSLARSESSLRASSRKSWSRHEESIERNWRTPSILLLPALERKKRTGDDAFARKFLN